MIQYKNNKEAEPPAATSLNSREVILPKTHSAESTVQPALPVSNADLLADGFNKLTVDSLCENSVAQGSTNTEFAIYSDQLASANPFDRVPFSDNPFFVHTDETSSSNTELGTNVGHDLFFFSSTETVTSYNASVGLETGHTNSFSLPITVEGVPGNDLPIGTERGHEDPFFMSNTETIPSNVQFETETDHGTDGALQMQGQETGHDITKNPFGNPFM